MPHRRGVAASLKLAALPKVVLLHFYYNIQILFLRKYFYTLKMSQVIVISLAVRHFCLGIKSQASLQRVVIYCLLYGR